MSPCTCAVPFLLLFAVSPVLSVQSRGKWSARPVTEAEGSYLLDYFNMERAFVKGSSMMALRYDYSLNAEAVRMVKDGVWDCSEPDDASADSDSIYPRSKIEIGDAIYPMLPQIAKLKKSTTNKLFEDCFAKKDYCIYAGTVLRDIAERLTCSVGECTKYGNKVVVCIFSPMKPYRESGFEKGERCSNCTAGSTCNEQKLCARNITAPSTTPTPTTPTTSCPNRGDAAQGSFGLLLCLLPVVLCSIAGWSDV